MASAKDIRTGDARSGDARLAELGFEAGAASTDAIATLRALRGTPGVSDGAIARALGAIVDAAAAAMLIAMEPGATGAARREIRRALFKLHQHGIAAPVAATAPTVAIEAEAGLSALLSPADGDGARVVWIMKARPGSGLRRLWGLVSEREGLFGVAQSALKRKELRAERAELERRAGVPMVDADWRVADFILCDAYRRTPAAQRGDVGNFFALRAELIAASPPAQLAHPVYAEFAAAIAHEPAAELMREPEVAAWTIDPNAVKSYAEEIAGLRNSVLVLSRPQQEERVGAVVERAIGDLLTGAVGTRLRRHLEDTGYYFARTGRGAQAGWAVAAAARIRDGAEIKRSGFFQTLMRAQLGAIIAEEEQHQRDEPRLIMTPAEAMRAREAARSRGRGR